MFGRVAHDLGAVAVRKDEAAFVRKDLGRHARMRGEEEAVAVEPVVGPLTVDAKILDRRLDLDDPDVALPRQRDEVGTPPGRQAEFGQHMRAHGGQQALHAAPHEQRALGLTAVDQGVQGNRRYDGHGRPCQSLFTI